MKNTKQFYIDEKVTTWRRTWYTVTEDENIVSVVESESLPDIDHSEIIYETEEAMTPEQNSGFSTVEVFSEEGVLLWSNGKN